MFVYLLIPDARMLGQNEGGSLIGEKVRDREGLEEYSYRFPDTVHFDGGDSWDVQVGNMTKGVP